MCRRPVHDVLGEEGQHPLPGLGGGGEVGAPLVNGVTTASLPSVHAQVKTMEPPRQKPTAPIRPASTSGCAANCPSAALRAGTH